MLRLQKLLTEYTCVGTYRSAELAQDTVLALRPLWALHGRDVNALKPLDNCRQHARCHHEFWGPGASGATHPQTTCGGPHHGFWCCTSCRWNVCYGSVVDSPPFSACEERMLGSVTNPSRPHIDCCRKLCQLLPTAGIDHAYGMNVMSIAHWPCGAKCLYCSQIADLTRPL